MNIKPLMMLVAAAAAGFSCTGSGGYHYADISWITLKTPVAVPSGHSRVYFQNGYEGVAANRYRNHCELMSNKLSKGSYRIKPGKFKVTGISRRVVSDYLTGMPARIFGCTQDDIYYETHIRLKSAANREVTKLVCREGSSDCFGRFATKQDIKTALGAKFSIK